MAKKRNLVQVSDNFWERLKEVQKKIRIKTGNDKSLRALTEEIASSSAFDEIEKNIINSGDINVDFNIRFDRRRLR